MHTMHLSSKTLAPPPHPQWSRCPPLPLCPVWSAYPIVVGYCGSFLNKLPSTYYFRQKRSIIHIEHRVGLWSVVHFLKINYLCALAHTVSVVGVPLACGRSGLFVFIFLHLIILTQEDQLY